MRKELRLLVCKMENIKKNSQETSKCENRGANTTEIRTSYDILDKKKLWYWKWSVKLLV